MSEFRGKLFYEMGREAHKEWKKYGKNAQVFPKPQAPYLPHDWRHQDWKRGWNDSEGEKK